MSLPARGAWIEIARPHWTSPKDRSLPARGAWIEMANYTILIRLLAGSLPARGAWIEIEAVISPETLALVAPREGSVD